MVEQLFGSQDEAPDFYVDSVRFGVGPYGFILELGAQGLADTQASEAPPIKRLALVRMSPQHAFVLAKLLQKNVSKYQEVFGKIVLPEGMLRELGLEPD